MKLAEEIINLSYRGYIVSIRPDLEEAFQIRLTKDGFNVCRICTEAQAKTYAGGNLEDYLIHTLKLLQLEMDYFRKEHGYDS